ncbi:MAG TPA: hypothetical protein PL169_24375 [Leptospiraceae bacterium]|nr:hypothetical protein [Leptospiraceae bacterium]
MENFLHKFRTKLICSAEEKRTLLPLAVLFDTLSEKARREGLNALEEDLYKINDWLIREGLIMVCSGTSADILQTIFENHLVSGDYSAVSFLGKIIALEGILLIQSADGPRTVRLILSSLYGEQAESVYSSAEKEFNSNFPDNDHIPGLEGEKEVIEEVQEFMENLSSLEESLPEFEPDEMPVPENQNLINTAEIYTVLKDDLRCSLEDKISLIPFVEKLSSIAEKSNKSGFIVLEKDLKGIESWYLRTGLELIAEGQEFSVLESFLLNNLYTSEYRGVRLLEKFLVFNSLVLLKAGYLPSMIRTHLFSFLGEAVNHSAQKPAEEELRSKIAEMEGRGPVSLHTDLLEELPSFDEEIIKTALFYIDTDRLVKAVFGASTNVKKTVISCLNSFSASLFLEEMENYSHTAARNWDSEEREIISAQEYLMQMIRKIDGH